MTQTTTAVGSPSGTAIGVRRVAGNIGAEITGVRAGPDLPGPVVRQIRDALLAHKVIFFRGQHHMDDAGQVGFAAQFGELSPNFKNKPEDDPARYVTDVDGDHKRASLWHSDATAKSKPIGLLMLRALVVPACGGDTAWANTVTAYQRMSPEMRELADGLRVVHSHIGDILIEARAKAAAQATEGGRETAVIAQEVVNHKSRNRKMEHPLVHVHPETGERALMLGAFASSIVGRDDSDALLGLLQAYVTSLDNTVRWRWRPGDIALWDNRATQHCGVDDFGSQKRLLHKCGILGQIPVGVDGRPSVNLAKLARQGEEQ